MLEYHEQYRVENDLGVLDNPQIKEELKELHEKTFHFSNSGIKHANDTTDRT